MRNVDYHFPGRPTVASRATDKLRLTGLPSNIRSCHAYGPLLAHLSLNGPPLVFEARLRSSERFSRLIEDQVVRGLRYQGAGRSALSHLAAESPDSSPTPPTGRRLSILGDGSSAAAMRAKRRPPGHYACRRPRLPTRRAVSRNALDHGTLIHQLPCNKFSLHLVKIFAIHRLKLLKIYS